MATEPAFGIKCLCPLLGKLFFFFFVPRLNTPVSLSVPEMAGIIYMPRGVGGEGGNLFEDVPLVEFMYVVFTRMPGKLP